MAAGKLRVRASLRVSSMTNGVPKAVNEIVGPAAAGSSFAAALGSVIASAANGS